jgi:hypothetical protein
MCHNLNLTASSIPLVPEQLEECNPRPKKMQKKSHNSGQDQLSWNFEELFLLDVPDTYATSNGPAHTGHYSYALNNTNFANPGSLNSWKESSLFCDPIDSMAIDPQFGCNPAEQTPIHAPPQPFAPRSQPAFLSRMELSLEDVPCPNNYRAIYNKAIGPQAYL